MMRFIALLVLCFYLHINLFGQCNVDDYKALRSLYYSTNGDYWKNKTNWDVKSENPVSNCDLSKFHGVYLDEKNRVFLISLGNNNLDGRIPSEIGQLTNLHTLWLEQNKLTGTIPIEIGSLDNIQRLALSYNSLNGELPSSLFNLKKLKELSIESNNFTGPLSSEFRNFTQIERLLVNNNNFSGILPLEIGNLVNLREIFFNNNNFEGCYPYSYKSLCAKNSNFSNNLGLANWNVFCEKSICEFNYKFKDVEFTIDTLFVSESKKKKHLIFIPEGFRKEELGKFKDYVIKVTSKLKNHFPAISFETILMNVPSNESGISNSLISPPVKKDTYFETDHVVNSYGEPSVFINDKVAYGFVKKYMPESKYPVGSRILVYIANSNLFGAYAASIEGVSTNYYISIEQNIGTNQDAEWVFAHELGHFFGHADIQDAHEVPQGEWANATRETDRNKIKWRSFIKATTPIPTPKNGLYDNEIGLFSVEDRQAKPTGWYRPCNNNCIMRVPSQHGNFCAVCANHLNRNDDLPFVKVENGTWGGYFYPGSKVNLKATSPEDGFVFSHWEGEGVGVVFDNIFNPSTSFTMPEFNIEIKAIFKKKEIILSNKLLDFDNVFVFPNPSSGIFEVSLPNNYEQYKISIFDLIGNKVAEMIPSNQRFTIDLKLKTGVYLFKATDNYSIKTMKLTILN